MEGKVKDALKDFVQELAGEVLEAEDVLDRLRGAQLDLRRVEPVAQRNPSSRTPRTWLLYYEPAQHLRERFDLAPEILVLFIPAKRALARDIHEAERAVLRDYRLDRGLVLVIARDHNAPSELEQPARHTGRTYVFLSIGDVAAVSNPQQWLRSLLLEQLGSSDLFAAGQPVLGWQFIGRQQELSSLRRHLLGGRPVGLYGLRKIGKTSLLLAARRQFIADSGTALAGDADTKQIVVPIHVDVQAIDFTDQNRPGFMRRLVRSTYETLSALDIAPSDLGLPSELAKTEHIRRLAPERVEREGITMIESLMDWAVAFPEQRRIILLIDEYERLLNEDVFPLKDGLAILEYLRGLAQSYPKSFNFLIAGLTRRLASRPTFLGRQNPLFDFLVDFPLAGLLKEEMNELLHKIGRRASLEFDAEALSLVWRETGGHPYLAREFGRVIDQAVPTVDRTPRKRILRGQATAARKAFRREVAHTMEELARALTELDPDVPFTLSYLHASPTDADEALRMLRPETVDELNRLGVLIRDEQGTRIRIGCFGAWLQENWQERSPMAASG